MLHDSHPTTRAPLGAKGLIVVAIVAGLIAVLQRTSLALLPHGMDDFIGGLAAGLAVSALFAWYMSRA